MPESGHLLTRMNWCTKCVKEHNCVSNLKRKLLYMVLFIYQTFCVGYYISIYLCTYILYTRECKHLAV